MIENSYYSRELHGPYELFDLSDFILEVGYTLRDCTMYQLDHRVNLDLLWVFHPCSPYSSNPNNLRHQERGFRCSVMPEASFREDPLPEVFREAPYPHASQ